MITNQTKSNPLPRPSNAHATCAWCRNDFPTIVALLAHVDEGHVNAIPAPRRGYPKAA